MNQVFIRVVLHFLQENQLFNQGLATGELRFILGPKDDYGESFSGEIFRVLKKQIRVQGKYWTKCPVLGGCNS